MSSPKLDCEYVCVCSIVCIPASLIMSRRACAHMFLYLHVYVLVCVCVCGLKPVMASLRVILCNTVLVLIIISPWACSGVQSPTRGAFGSVGEVLEAAWPRCAPSFPLRRVPGTACTSGKPSLTMRLPAQPTPCLNRAGGCHVMPNTHMQEGLLAHTNARTYTHLHKADSWWVRHMFGRCSGGESECVESNLTESSLAVCAGEKHHRLRLLDLRLVILSAFVLCCYWVKVNSETNIGHAVHTLICYLYSEGLNPLESLK